CRTDGELPRGLRRHLLPARPARERTSRDAAAVRALDHRHACAKSPLRTVLDEITRRWFAKRLRSLPATAPIEKARMPAAFSPWLSAGNTLRADCCRKFSIRRRSISAFRVDAALDTKSRCQPAKSRRSATGWRR